MENFENHCSAAQGDQSGMRCHQGALLNKPRPYPFKTKEAWGGCGLFLK